MFNILPVDPIISEISQKNWNSNLKNKTSAEVVNFMADIF